MRPLELGSPSNFWGEIAGPFRPYGTLFDISLECSFEFLGFKAAASAERTAAPGGQGGVPHVQRHPPPA